MSEQPPCDNCDSTGWVCEGHAGKPWKGCSNRADACDCGPGMPCRVCNGSGGREDVPRMPAGSTVVFDKNGYRQ